jgi:hypothetical protein
MSAITGFRFCDSGTAQYRDMKENRILYGSPKWKIALSDSLVTH